jgi:serine phosphatase RsbU (regulator of sigma subunit)
MKEKISENKLPDAGIDKLSVPAVLLNNQGTILTQNCTAEEVLSTISGTGKSAMEKNFRRMIKKYTRQNNGNKEIFNFVLNIPELDMSKTVMLIPFQKNSGQIFYQAYFLPGDSNFVKNDERYIHYLKTINKISSKSYRFKTILALTRFITSELFNREYDFFHVGVFLRENLYSGKEVILIDVVGESRDLFRNNHQKKYRQSINTGVIGWVVRNGKAVILKNTDESDLYHSTPYFRGKSEICVPINLLNEVVGVINIESKDQANFDDADLSLLRTVADIYADNIYRIHTTLEIHRKNLKLQKYLEEIRKAKESLEIQSRELKILLKRGKEARKQIKKQNELMQNKLKMGSELQKSLLPREFPELSEIKFDFSYRPNSQLGGDFFDVCRLDDNHLGIIIADVSGYGVSAAMIAAMFKAFFNNSRNFSTSPSDIFGIINREFHSIINTGDFISAFYMILNIRNFKGCYTNAGHPFPLLFRGRKNRIELLDAPGYFIGVFDEDIYQNRKLSLEPGDRILFYTDGVIEAKNLSGQEFGRDRLKRLFRMESIAKSRGEVTLKKLTREMFKFTNTRSFKDDVTLLLLERHPA